MSAEGMLAAVNRARLAAWPATATQPGAREWRLLEHATPLAVTARRAAAASGGTDALLTTLHQQMAPLEPTPLDATQVRVVRVASGRRPHTMAGAFAAAACVCSDGGAVSP